MAARAPLDVDLEDKLVYGLTPMRLAYMAVAMLAGFALWSSQWAPEPVRGICAAAVIAVGAAAAWGRWHGRAADQWASDITIFVARNYRVEWHLRWRRRRSASQTASGDKRDRPELPVELAA
jgi:hypothetical protein